MPASGGQTFRLRNVRALILPAAPLVCSRANLRARSLPPKAQDEFTSPDWARRQAAASLLPKNVNVALGIAEKLGACSTKPA